MWGNEVLTAHLGNDSSFADELVHWGIETRVVFYALTVNSSTRIFRHPSLRGDVTGRPLMRPGNTSPPLGDPGHPVAEPTAAF